MTQEQSNTPKHLLRLILRDLSAAPDHKWTERMSNRYRTPEDQAILDAWQPSFTVVAA